MIDASSEIIFGFLIAAIGFVTTYLPKVEHKLIMDGLALILLPFPFITSILSARDPSDVIDAGQLFIEYIVAGVIGDIGGSLFNKLVRPIAEFIASLLD